jgi:Fe-S oxidoreductase
LMPFECTLCGLCAAVCPVHLDPSQMFLTFRQVAVLQGKGDFKEHTGLLRYEKIGISSRFSWYPPADRHEVVLFPGCALSGTRPDNVMKLYELLRKQLPGLGIVLDCCGKPSHDLGRMADFSSHFRKMNDTFMRRGIRHILVACPSCHATFKTYSRDIAVSTVYEVLQQCWDPPPATVSGTVAIHDPCTHRFDRAIQNAVRGIVSQCGLTIKEMRHHGRETLCCGEGGAARFITPRYAEKWKKQIEQDSAGRKIITYCAGCVDRLGCKSALHVIDLLFAPEEALSEKIRTARPPFRFGSRLMLRHSLARIAAERTG